MSTTTQEVIVTETKIVMADPTALGVFGLAMVTFVAASQKLGLTTGSAYIVPWAIFLGSAAQIWAATVDFKKNNYFGATVLGSYGLFWLAVSMHWAIGQGWLGAVDPAKADPSQLAYACFGYFFFSIFIMIASFEANKVFAAILVLINVLLPSLGFVVLKISPEIFAPMAAWSELGISLLGFYAAGAIFLNNFFGRTILSLGKPFGWIRKGPALPPQAAAPAQQQLKAA
jgi:succinate-acetate transporter protein